MKDDGVSIENADFWGMKNPENEKEYYIMPGIKQNRRSARLVADDGAIANRLFEGIFTIRNGRSFDLLTVARGTLNGEQLIITQKGEVQLPN